MKTITTTTTVYNFSELSDEAKQNAIEKLWHLNAGHEWWESTYDDAERIGLQIGEFDIDRRNMIKGDLKWSGKDVADAIIKEHGPDCDTYKLASNFLIDYKNHCTEFDGNLDNEDEEFEDSYIYSELEIDFKRDLLEEYLCMLRNEYEYQTSEAQIIESIEANEYDFLENGTLH